MSDIKQYFAKNQAKAHENFLHISGDAAKAAGNAAQGAGSAASGGDPIGQLIKLAGDITVGVYSTNQQIKLQKELAKLSSAEQARLAEQLGKATTKTQQLQLLQQAQNQAKNRNITLIVVGSLIGIAGIVLAVVLVRKGKK